MKATNLSQERKSNRDFVAKKTSLAWRQYKAVFVYLSTTNSNLLIINDTGKTIRFETSTTY